MTDTLSDRVFTLNDDYEHQNVAYTRDIREKLQEVVEMIDSHKSDGETKQYCIYGIKNKIKEIMGDKLMNQSQQGDGSKKAIPNEPADTSDLCENCGHKIEQHYYGCVNCLCKRTKASFKKKGAET